jgi:hypothetical protein
MTDSDPSTTTRAALPGWLSRPDSVAPTVLILGGFITMPPQYRPLVGRLYDRGAAGVVVANVWTPDWLLAGARGIGPICTRSAKALRDAVHLSAEVSGGAPLLVIGHSAGGVTARLLTAAEPLPGRRYGASRWIGAIVSLGTPHRLSTAEGIGRRMNEVAASIANEAVPGAYFSPAVSYVSVASRKTAGDPSGTPNQRIAHLLYRSIIGRAAVAGTEGDGLVPVSATRLDGARHIILDDVLHGVGLSVPWYGSDRALDVWWPIAVDAWRAALRVRAEAAGAPAATLAGQPATPARGPRAESARRRPTRTV